MGKLKQLLIITFLLIISGVLAPGLYAAEGRALVSFLDESGLDLSWEPYLETGRVSQGYKSVSFRLGEPWLLVDRTGKIPCEPLQKSRGTLFIPASTEKVIHEIFFPIQHKTPRIGAIFIDPGHGGKDPGTIGRHTINGKKLILSEKDLVLSTALMLGEMLKKRYPDKQIVYSRSRDVYLDLEARTEKAHAVKIAPQDAIIFISIHAHASLNPRGKGYEVWYLPPTYRRDLLGDDGDGEIPEVKSILNLMKDEEFSRESILLAQSILKGFDDEVAPLSESRGLKEESWFVVRKAKMPSVLVEIGFVTNPQEAKLLANRSHLRKIAQAIYAGINSFVRQFEDKHKKGSGP
ncbi:MAG: N-acetylmuramoyl-L-alanine amidase [Spirochaetales bacterium]|jgi:N-acetylmuramoyl-L-alanine amidase|nr:N-acetylmuramoyl-L-alanine amidase [Spirochaetales bacterium]